MEFFSKTDQGRRRQLNQDYVFASKEAVGKLPNLFLLADGMGAVSYTHLDAADEL